MIKSEVNGEGIGGGRGLRRGETVCEVGIWG